MKRTTLALICGLACMSAPAHAQTDPLSQDEIVERFKAQKTRGLSIAPVGTQPAAPAAATNVAPAATAAATPGPVIAMPADVDVNINISFDFDSAALRVDQKPKLTQLCGAMQALGDESFRILGHTDASGSAAYNKQLSRLRAEEVKRFLIAECGITGARLQATGAGEELLLDASDPRGDVNRRVEFQVLG